MLGWLILASPCYCAAQNLATPQSTPGKPTTADAEYIRKLIPERIEGSYAAGRLIRLEVAGRQAYVIEPTGEVDSRRRWI